MTNGGENDFADWGLDEPAGPPAPVSPLPAIQHPDLRGRRVQMGLPGLGWRADLRADAPVVQGSRTYVPVLSEQEWYRAESERTEVFAPLVPIERVWVETIDRSGAELAVPGGGDIVSRLVSLDLPPRRHPRPAGEAGNLTGRRVVQLVLPPDAAPVERRDLRAVTEPYSSAEGDICVRIAAELDWYRWAWTGQAPRTLAVPVHLIWVE